MISSRYALCIVLASVAGCDQEPDDVNRAAEDLDLEAEDAEEEDAPESEPVGMPVRAESADPTRADASDPDGEPSGSLPLEADVDPDAMKPRWSCGGNPEEGTYICCTELGPYGLPYCCWWNGSGYDCG